MSASRLELLLHPVRLRLVHAMDMAGMLTTSQLCGALLDVPKATVYRQVERLVRGGIFEVERSRQVRGAVERLYRLAPGGAVVGVEAARSMKAEDHRRGFTAAMGALIGDFNAYLDRGAADPMADEVSYRQFTIWLRPTERSRLVRAFERTLRTIINNKPAADRDAYRISTVFFPTSARQPIEGSGKGFARTRRSIPPGRGGAGRAST
jgi:DNA-binding transcriptional ArsR family regulator